MPSLRMPCAGAALAFALSGCAGRVGGSGAASSPPSATQSPAPAPSASAAASASAQPNSLYLESPSPLPTSEASASPEPTTSPHPTPTPLPIAVIGSRRGRDPFRMTQFARDGSIRYTLIADSLRGHYSGTDTGTSDLANPHVTFLATKGKRLIADAPAGTVVEKDKTLLMNGGVHARSQDGMTLASDTLRYDDQTQLVHGEGHVVVTFPKGERLTGDTVDWNLRTGNVEMNAAP